VAERKPFLLRVDRNVLDAMQRWADDDLRSLNGQIEFVLRAALKRAGRSASARAAIDQTNTVEYDTPADSTDT
jgi:hypothetical protein